MFDEIASNKRRSYLLIAAFALLIAGVIYSAGIWWDLGTVMVVPAVLICCLLRG